MGYEVAMTVPVSIGRIKLCHGTPSQGGNDGVPVARGMIVVENDEVVFVGGNAGAKVGRREVVETGDGVDVDVVDTVTYRVSVAGGLSTLTVEMIVVADTVATVSVNSALIVCVFVTVSGGLGDGDELPSTLTTEYACRTSSGARSCILSGKARVVPKSDAMLNMETFIKGDILYKGNDGSSSSGVRSEDG